MKTIITLLAFILFATSFTFSQKRTVDNFKNGDNNVEVIFYDHSSTLMKISKDFPSKSDKEKSDMLDKFLRENPLYLFRLTNHKTKETLFLCIRGNSKVENTSAFYKVEVIKGVNADFDPTKNDYSGKIVHVIDKVNCRGYLFENMSAFETVEGKKLVGNGILLFWVLHQDPALFRNKNFGNKYYPAIAERQISDGTWLVGRVFYQKTEITFLSACRCKCRVEISIERSFVLG